MHRQRRTRAAGGGCGKCTYWTIDQIDSGTRVQRRMAIVMAMKRKKTQKNSDEIEAEVRGKRCCAHLDCRAALPRRFRAERREVLAVHVLRKAKLRRCASVGLAVRPAACHATSRAKHGSGARCAPRASRSVVEGACGERVHRARNRPKCNKSVRGKPARFADPDLFIRRCRCWGTQSYSS